MTTMNLHRWMLGWVGRLTARLSLGLTWVGPVPRQQYNYYVCSHHATSFCRLMPIIVDSIHLACNAPWCSLLLHGVTHSDIALPGLLSCTGCGRLPNSMHPLISHLLECVYIVCQQSADGGHQKASIYIGGNDPWVAMAMIAPHFSIFMQ